MTRYPDTKLTELIDRYSPIYRPTWVDCFCLLVGCTLSLVLAKWSGFIPHPSDSLPPWAKEHVLLFLTEVLFLPIGILAFWPVYYLTQWLRGRTEGLSSGEWLWGIAWLAVLPWITWVVWQRWGTLPETMHPETLRNWMFIGFAIGVLALGSLAALVAVIGTLVWRRQPWTHGMALVLLIWPAVWLGCCLAWGIEFK